MKDVPNAMLVEPNRVYLHELAHVVGRKEATIKMWLSRQLIPERLLPQPGKRGRLYWTHSQVFGPRGVIAWMKLRSRDTWTVAGFDRWHVEQAHKLCLEGDNRAEIQRKLRWAPFPPKYDSHDRFDAALVRLFILTEYPLPPRYLTPAHLWHVRQMVAGTRGLDQITRRLMKRLPYSSQKQCEMDVMREFAKRGWRINRRSLSQEQRRIMRELEKYFNMYLGQ